MQSGEEGGSSTGITGGDEEDGIGSVPKMILTVGIAAVLVILLLLTGLKISNDNLREVKQRGLGPICIVVGVDFLGGPLLCACLCAVLHLRMDWALGLMVFCVTPPTVAAPMMAYMVGADVALTLSASIATLACSIVGTPVFFSAGMLLFEAMSDGAGSDTTLKLPIGEIVGTMCVLLLCAAIGVKLNAIMSEKSVARLEKGLKRILLPLLPAVMISFFLTPGLVSSTFYTGASAGKFWLAAVAVHWLALPVALLLIAVASKLSAEEYDSKTRDSILIAILRRNPALAMGVAALSFSNSDNINFDSAFGMVLACNFGLDAVATPALIFSMRKLRYGTFCKKGDDEQETDVTMESGIEEQKQQQQQQEKTRTKEEILEIQELP